MTPNDKKFVAFVATVVIIFTAALVVKEVARINPMDQVESEQSEQEHSDKEEEVIFFSGFDDETGEPIEVFRA